MIKLPRLTLVQWIPLVTLGLVLLVWLWLAAHFWGQYRAYHQESYDLIPRIARLKGLVASEAALRDANDSVREELAGLTYPMTQDPAATGAQLQQQVRAALEAAGLSVAGSQILPPQIDRLFTRIQLDLTASGSMEALEGGLLALEEVRPLVILESVSLQPVRSRRRGDEQQLVNVRLRLVALRLGP